MAGVLWHNCVTEIRGRIYSKAMQLKKNTIIKSSRSCKILPDLSEVTWNSVVSDKAADFSQPFALSFSHRWQNPQEKHPAPAGRMHPPALKTARVNSSSFLVISLSLPCKVHTYVFAYITVTFDKLFPQLSVLPEYELLSGREHVFKLINKTYLNI